MTFAYKVAKLINELNKLGLRPLIGLDSDNIICLGPFYLNERIVHASASIHEEDDNWSYYFEFNLGKPIKGTSSLDEIPQELIDHINSPSVSDIIETLQTREITNPDLKDVHDFYMDTKDIELAVNWLNRNKNIKGPKIASCNPLELKWDLGNYKLYKIFDHTEEEKEPDFIIFEEIK